MLNPTYPIHTERLLLRPFQADDLDDAYAYYALPEVVRFLYWETRNREETKKALEQKKASFAGEGSMLVVAVALKETDKVIGEISLAWRSREHQQGEIGFVFNPAFQGAGYATEAAKVVLSLGFDKLNLHRIYARCDARNTASYRLMERLGMRREAHFIHNEIFKGEWGEEFLYALLQAEWIAQNTNPV